MPPRLTPPDLAALSASGRSLADIETQLALLADPPAPLRLVRPARPGDGVTQLEPGRLEPQSRWREAARRGRLACFVPASGAATRMFGFLPDARADDRATLADLERRAAAGEENLRGLLELLAGLPRLPFFEDLAARVEQLTGSSWRALRRDSPLALTALLVGEQGLGLAALPKGLLPFHRYRDGWQTPFAEHVAQARHYLLADQRPSMTVHFTVSPDHLESFRRAGAAIARNDAAHGLTTKVDFSIQDPATDTVALDSDGELLRAADGRLVFRPGGHGALLSNLAALAASGTDIVFLQNIDNIGRARSHSIVGRWKRLLCEHLLALESRCFELLAQLDENPKAAVEAAAAFVTESLTLELPPEYARLDRSHRAAFLRQRLHRPLRVCGVVANRGEPGGGPFWVRRADGSTEGQIVEGSQVDLDDAGQRSIWEASTHFNPVDVVCSLRDRRGQPYDLSAWVDPATAFVARKAHESGTITVLERPGLWNGAMAGWNTCFVEVPEETFTPVKTILDLLRPAHQPRSIDD